MRFILSCILRGSSLVRAVVQHAITVARYNSVIGSNVLYCCERYCWVAADFLAGEIDLSNTITFLKFCHTLVGNREICVARSLFEVICVRLGELYKKSPIIFFPAF